MGSYREEWSKQFASTKRVSEPLIGRKADDYLRALRAVGFDRQADAEKNAPETEWRRAHDLNAALKTHGKVLQSIIEDMTRFGIFEMEKEFSEASKREEEDDPDVRYSPCRDATSLLDSVLCCRRTLGKFQRWCEEDQDAWNFWTPYWMWTGQRLNDIWQWCRDHIEELLQGSPGFPSTATVNNRYDYRTVDQPLLEGPSAVDDEADVGFPELGPQLGGSVIKTSPTEYQFAIAGTYDLSFQVSLGVDTSAVSGGEMVVYLEKDTGTGYQEVDGSRAYYSTP